MNPDASQNESVEDDGAIDRLSRLFARAGTWSYDHRWIVTALCLGVLGISVYFAEKVRFDNSYEAYFDETDPVYKAYLDFRDDFGSDELSYIMYDAPGYEYGPWNLEIMRKIAALTEAIEAEVPFIKEVTSLANIEFVEGVEDGLEVHDLLDPFPATQQELLEFREKILSKPFYIGGIISEDAAFAAVIIEMERSSIDAIETLKLDPDGGDELDNLYPQVSHERIEEILARPDYAGIRFHHAGDVALNSVYNRVIESESARLGLISFVAIGALLFFFFRSPIGVIGPLAVVGLSVLVSVGFVGLLGWELDLMFTMLPTILIAVGVADAVHIISEFKAYDAELGDRRESARRTLFLVATPCLLTSLTTAAGFSAMSISPIKAISHFAIYSAFGVLVAFLLSLTLLMVLLSIGRRRPRTGSSERRKSSAKGGQYLGAFLEGVCRFDIRFRKPILVFFGALFVFSAMGVSRLTVDSNFLDEFGDTVPIKRITLFVDSIMGGSGNMIYLFDTGEPDGIKDPEVLREIERLQNRADLETGLVVHSTSVVDMLKDINRSFHAEDPNFYVLPESRALVAQYLLVYELSGGEEIMDYISSDYSRARLELRCKLVSTSHYEALERTLNEYLAEDPLEASTVTVTGMGALWLRLSTYLTSSQIRGFLLAFVVVAAMMCVAFSSVRIGLLSMIPNLAPVILTLGVMGWLGIPLDYVRLLLGAVAIGISVDDTIHHVSRFRREFLRSRDYEAALSASMRDVGRALFITSVVLIVGFLVFLPSILDTLVTFGVLVAATVFVALVADFLLMPALVLTFEPFGPSGARGDREEASLT